MEGIHLRGVMPEVRARVTGLTCRGVFMEHERVMSLDFGGFLLVLDGRPEVSGLFVSRSAVRIPPKNPSWEHHLKGAVVTRAVQAGLDRVLVLGFERNSVYDRGPCAFYFELTGRNANMILTREPDQRIIACLRRIGSQRNRYRTVSPGGVYVPPPPSGLPPELWHTAKLPPDPGPRDLYGLLEGVGPVGAGAILERSRETGGDVTGVLAALAADLLEERLPSWIPTPGPAAESSVEEPPAALRELETRLNREQRELNRKLSASRLALENLQKPETFRTWGNLILTGKQSLKRGMETALLPDYSGGVAEIPLKKALNPPENAARYFRKAAGVNRERERIAQRVLDIEHRLGEIQELVDNLSEIPRETVEELLGKTRKRGEPRQPREYILAGGWRVLVGRNARENAELTFGKASRDDFWLHARGTPGPHVILKRDGRRDNPPEAILQQAADIAARHAGRKGILPVDCTLVKYVRRVRGAPQGFVTYTRETTLFSTVK
jgi:predicted ribosome quality control (RQC) complex YloA/Tae2 family protein